MNEPTPTESYNECKDCLAYWQRCILAGLDDPRRTTTDIMRWAGYALEAQMESIGFASQRN